MSNAALVPDTHDPLPPSKSTPARVREALRGVRLAFGTYREPGTRTAFATLELAVAALLTEHEQLLQRVAVAREGAQVTLDAGDEVQHRLRLVRAHLELGGAATVAGRARAHEQMAATLLSDLGVAPPNAADMALATVQVTP